MFLSLTNKGDKLLLFLDAIGEPIEVQESTLADLYEQAFFTTFQYKANKVPLWNFHWNRLTRSAQHYSIELGHSLEESILKNLKKISHDSRVRVTMSFGEVSSFKIIIETQKLDEEKKDSLKLKTMAQKSCTRPSYIKLGNYKKAFEKRTKLQREGYDDFLFWEESNGRILESTVSNVIYCQKGLWFTPKIDFGVLEGSTRFALIELGLVEEKDLQFKDLADCTSMFLINAIKEIVSVESIDDRKLFIDQKMRQLCSTKLRDKMWNTAIDI